MTERQRKLARQAMFGAAVALVALSGGMAVATGQDQNDKHPVARQLDASEVKQRSYRVADLFGESDEEKAARLQKEQAQDGAISALQQHVDDLEASIRRMTGQIEQQDHKIAELNAKIDRMQKDFDYKICTMAAQQLGEQSDGGGLGCAGGEGGAQPSAQVQAPARNTITGATGGYAPPASDNDNQPIHLSPPPGVLGTLPADKSDSAPTPAAPSAHQGKFDAAKNLMVKARYDEARAAFRAYADQFPDDSLAPEAVYWVGDIAYVQKDYDGAARAFIEEIKKFPDSERAPQSMLMLGQALVAMGRKKEGCTGLADLPTRYPNASKSVLARAAAARKGAGCK